MRMELPVFRLQVSKTHSLDMELILRLGYTTDVSKTVMVAFSTVSDFQIRLSSENPNETSIHLVVSIRDTLDCVTLFNLSLVTVVIDVSPISGLMDTLLNSPQALTSNPLVQLLSSGNQNAVGQVITAISQQFNRISTQAVEDALSSKLSLEAN